MDGMNWNMELKKIPKSESVIGIDDKCEIYDLSTYIKHILLYTLSTRIIICECKYLTLNLIKYFRYKYNYTEETIGWKCIILKCKSHKA